MIRRLLRWRVDRANDEDEGSPVALATELLGPEEARRVARERRLGALLRASRPAPPAAAPLQARILAAVEGRTRPRHSGRVWRPALVGALVLALSVVVILFRPPTAPPAAAPVAVTDDPAHVDLALLPQALVVWPSGLVFDPAPDPLNDELLALRADTAAAARFLVSCLPEGGGFAP